VTARLSPEDLEALGRLDTCTVANAIEAFGVRLRNDGFTDPSLHCFTPNCSPVVGFAETLTVRSSLPPPEMRSYIDRTDWWSELTEVPAPRILVIEDIGPKVGRGAFVGGVHGHILKAFGCVAAVTNGAVRDIPEIASAGLQVFGGNLSPSHAYVHVVQHGQPVEIAGLAVAAGDLLHADLHGVVRVPLEIAHEIPRVAADLQRRERAIVDLCRSSSFSAERLRDLVRPVQRDEG
jgi:4-hydroxy-4-methyl-2-oxoglutarate aldolase